LTGSPFSDTIILYLEIGENNMKHIKNQFKKIPKEAIKKGASTLVLLFFAMVMLFQKDSSNTQLQFVRNSDENLVHGAANDNPTPSQRDYLFQNETGNPEYQGSIVKWTAQPAVISTPDTPNPDMPKKDSIDNLINPNEVAQVIDNTPAQTGKLYPWTLYTWTIHTGEQIIPQKDAINTTKPTSLDCITPRKEEVKNSDFILAYEQRKDVNTICNVQKRVCTNGILWGTFTQRSCKDNLVYEYRKAEVISYNQKVLNDYIQPTQAVNAWAEFSNEGKINTTETPTNTRGTTNKPVINDKEVAQTPLSTKASCITTRWQTVKHGQFVKAYKTPRGFVDMQCEVEIRPCVNGTLKGSFTYPKCTFKNITYTDYLQWKSKEFTQPTAQDLSQSINQEFTEPAQKSFRSFDRIKWVLK